MMSLQSKTTFIIAIAISFLVIILFPSCNTTSNDDNSGNDENAFPYLSIKNQSTESRLVIRVGLVGYDFNDLRIENGESIIFELNNGMPAGHNDVNVNATYVQASRNFTTSLKVDFTKGDTTVLRFINDDLFLE